MRQRRWWVALAILALAFLSLRPACDVWLSHWSKHGGTHAATAHSMQAHAPAHAPDEPGCCATIESRTLVNAFDAMAWQSGPSKLAAASLAVPMPIKVALALVLSLTASVIPPGNPPFYARSARILR